MSANIRLQTSFCKFRKSMQSEKIGNGDECGEAQCDRRAFDQTSERERRRAKPKLQRMPPMASRSAPSRDKLTLRSKPL